MGYDARHDEDYVLAGGKQDDGCPACRLEAARRVDERSRQALNRSIKKGTHYYGSGNPTAAVEAYKVIEQYKDTRPAHNYRIGCGARRPNDLCPLCLTVTGIELGVDLEGQSVHCPHCHAQLVIAAPWVYIDYKVGRRQIAMLRIPGDLPTRLG